MKMVHADPINTVLAAAVIILAFFVLRQLWRTMNSNLQLVADVLHGEINYPFLNLPLYFVVEGLYKGRKVACYCNPLGTGKRSGGDTKFSIEPKSGLKEASFLCLQHDGPTDVTYIEGNKIYCREPVSAARQRNAFVRRADLFKPISRQDLIAYLEQLTVAAERVENGASRARTTA
jgi:hypothetical protein